MVSTTRTLGKTAPAALGTAGKSRQFFPKCATSVRVFYDVRKETEQEHAEGEELAKLGKARLEAAEKAYKLFNMGELSRPFSDTSYQLSIRWLNAELDIAHKKGDRITGHKAHLQRMKDWKKVFVDDGQPPGALRVVVIESFQMEAEYWLARERLANK